MSEQKLGSKGPEPTENRGLKDLIDEMSKNNLFTNGKLAVDEKDAAALLSLNPWQLRDLRLGGKIDHIRIVGKKVRYTPEILMAYLEKGLQRGTA